MANDKSNNIIIRGYQPDSSLDTDSPPKGGSGLTVYGKNQHGTMTSKTAKYSRRSSGSKVASRRLSKRSRPGKKTD